MTINEASARTPVATPSTVPAFAGNHQIKPLKFDPARLEGLSERLITSHHENNYAGSVKTLNALRPRLAAALADTEAPPAVYGGIPPHRHEPCGRLWLDNPRLQRPHALAQQSLGLGSHARRCGRHTAARARYV